MTDMSKRNNFIMEAFPLTITSMIKANDIILQVNKEWWHFHHPVQVVVATHTQQVLSALHEIETAVAQHHLYAAGFLSYEASAAFGLATHPPRPDDLPLLWFGLYQQPEKVRPPQSTGQPPSPKLTWQPAISEATYHATINHIKTHIAAGHTYQVNYTFPLYTAFSGDTWALFCQLTEAQQADYAAYIDIGSHIICSASPELFFKLEGKTLLSKPMKGTTARGRTLAEDEANQDWLYQSAKNRAENVMIVDMIRNDMGRVATIGTVQVPHLFAIERYPTVLQMTSTVTACTTASLCEIFTAMYPCASITGAPKQRTMQIIKALEGCPRGVYTGTIGYLAPTRQAQFNVAIRTVVINQQQQQAIYGVGGGIVWDSEAAAEYEECRIKAQVLTEKRPSFHLIESLLWTPDEGYFLLEEHIARLMASAAYFGFAGTETAVCHHLISFAQTLAAPTKVRLLLAPNGETSITTVPLTTQATAEPVRVGLATTPVQCSNIWLYHKTTQRQQYEEARASRPDCDDVLLWNERGELTEASSANVVIRLKGKWVTPPVTSGLLAGTLRGWLLQNGRIQEQVLTPADLLCSEEIWLINSVRKWRQVQFVAHGVGESRHTPDNQAHAAPNVPGLPTRLY